MMDAVAALDASWFRLAKAIPATNEIAVGVEFNDGVYMPFVYQAPQRAVVWNGLLDGRASSITEGDGIITFCRDHPSRVSYRKVEFDAETDCWIVERIS